MDCWFEHRVSGGSKLGLLALHSSVSCGSVLYRTGYRILVRNEPYMYLHRGHVRCNVNGECRMCDQKSSRRARIRARSVGDASQTYRKRPPARLHRPWGTASDVRLRPSSSVYLHLRGFVKYSLDERAQARQSRRERLSPGDKRCHPVSGDIHPGVPNGSLF